jgi:hypothetical protein
MKIEQVNKLLQSVYKRYEGLLFMEPFYAKEVATKLEKLGDEDSLAMADEIKRRIKLYECVNE